jgi:nanoRNase/pAp phosphatase (c-di-AMP/oligoRNAs hydrolase)
MKNLAAACASKNIEEILAMPDVLEREKVYFEEEAPFREMLKKYSKLDGNVIIIDLRGLDVIHVGNRFLIYTIFPEQNISVWTIDGRAGKNCAITVGHSIINRSATLNVGSMLLKYGGGGHKQVGTCQVPYEEADKTIAEVVELCKAG